MQLKVLGSAGSVTPEGQTCSFLVGERMVFEMGSAASVLSIAAQCRIDDVFLTHAHLDHVKDLAFLAENVFGGRDVPVNVRGLPATLETFANHIMNGAVWPDFTALPSPENPTLRYVPVEPGRTIKVGGLRVTAVEVNHPGGCVAYVLDSGAGALVLCGDTGPTDALWQFVNEAGAQVRGIMIETSFPDRLHALADVSGHLTPALLGAELCKLDRRDIPVHICHIKAPTRDETVAELAALGDERVRVLEPGTVLEF